MIHAWPVANVDATPVLVVVDPGSPLGETPAHPRDYLIATACIEAFVRFLSAHASMFSRRSLPREPIRDRWVLEAFPSRPAIVASAPPLRFIEASQSPGPSRAKKSPVGVTQSSRPKLSVVRGGAGMEPPDAGDYLELEVTIEGSKPRVWRRFLIDETATFLDLHRALQVCFGWTDNHLWEFRTFNGRQAVAGIETPGAHDGEETPAAEDKTLSDFFGIVKRCLYIYDFGDDWRHRIELRRRVPRDGASNERKLLAGRGATPIEDCGGIPGHERLVAFVLTGEDPWDDDDEGRLVSWVGDWHPKRFDIKTARVLFDG